MSWVAVAIGGSALIAGGVSYVSGKKSAEAAKDAAKTEADAKRQALAEARGDEAIPRELRDKALTQLGGLYGLNEDGPGQQEFIDRAMKSPLYASLMGNQAAGEESILRNQAATGGFRSGSTQANLYDYNTRLKNEALLSSYSEQLGGLQSLAQLPTNIGQITALTAGIGETEAAGTIGSAQAQQVANQNAANTIAGAGQAYAQYYSDIRLKDSIQLVGKLDGHNWYSWEWKPEAKALGLTGESEGVMAHEVYEYAPEAISTDNGLLMVDYKKLGGAHA